MLTNKYWLPSAGVASGLIAEYSAALGDSEPTSPPGPTSRPISPIKPVPSRKGRYIIASRNRVMLKAQVGAEGRRRRSLDDKIVNACETIASLGETEPKSRALQRSRQDERAQRGRAINQRDLRSVPVECGAGSIRIAEDQPPMIGQGKINRVPATRGDIPAIIKHLHTAIGPHQKAEFTRPSHRKHTAGSSQGTRRP